METRGRNVLLLQPTDFLFSHTSVLTPRLKAERRVSMILPGFIGPSGSLRPSARTDTAVTRDHRHTDGAI